MRSVRCRDCGRRFQLAEDGATYCPHCGRFYARDTSASHKADAPLDELPRDLVAVACADNLAEAGYFQSVLEGEGIQAYIDTQHQAALSGFGAREVVLMVPDTQAGRAVELLEAASGHQADDPDAPLEDEDEDTAGARTVGDHWSWWKPLLVAGAFVAAGLLVLRALTSVPARVPRRPGAPPARQADPVRTAGQFFWRHVADQPGRWVLKRNGDATPRRILEYDPQNDAWVVAEDTDEDGRLDRWHAVTRDGRTGETADLDRDGQPDHYRNGEKWVHIPATTQPDGQPQDDRQ